MTTQYFLRILGIASMTLHGCAVFGSDLCDTVVQKEASSPNGAYVATVFHRECGATTDFNTQLNVRRSSSGFDHRSGQVFAIAGRHELAVEWDGVSRLVVGEPSDQVYRRETQWEELQVSYEAVAAQAK